MKKKADFTDDEVQAAQEILEELRAERITEGIGRLRVLKDEIYASIAEKQRISRGITWVVERISDLFVQVCGEEETWRWSAQVLYDHLEGRACCWARRFS